MLFISSRFGGMLFFRQSKQKTYNFLKNELEYLANDREIYEIDKGNGEPSYYDDPKEAYENM